MHIKHIESLTYVPLVVIFGYVVCRLVANVIIIINQLFMTLLVRTLYLLLMLCMYIARTEIQMVMSHSLQIFFTIFKLHVLCSRSTTST